MEKMNKKKKQACKKNKSIGSKLLNMHLECFAQFVATYVELVFVLHGWNHKTLIHRSKCDSSRVVVCLLGIISDVIANDWTKLKINSKATNKQAFETILLIFARPDGTKYVGKQKKFMFDNMMEKRN